MPATIQTAHQATPATLCVIETNPQLSDILTSTFGQDSHSVYHANTAKIGFTAAKHASLVCVDLMLEDVDGSSLIEDIRMTDANKPIIAFIDKADCEKMDMDIVAVRKLSEACGANALVVTPAHLGELLQTIQRLLPEQGVAIAV